MATSEGLAAGAGAETEGSAVEMSSSPQHLFAAGLDLVTNGMGASWDPLFSPDWDQEKPTEQCFLRIKR